AADAPPGVPIDPGPAGRELPPLGPGASSVVASNFRTSAIVAGSAETRIVFDTGSAATWNVPPGCDPYIFSRTAAASGAEAYFSLCERLSLPPGGRPPGPSPGVGLPPSPVGAASITLASNFSTTRRSSGLP